MPASITAHPAHPAHAEVLGQEQHAEERRERRLEREHERRARRRRSRLHPGRHEVAECAREHAGHDERVPRRRIGRRLDLSGCERDHREPGERDGHLEDRQRPRVVSGRPPFHRDYLEGLRDGIPEHEQVPRPRATGGAAQKEKPRQREDDADPHGRRHRRSEGREGEQRREDDVEAGDETRARDRRQLEAGGLEAVGETEEGAGDDPGRPAGAGQGAERAPGEGGERERRDREADGEKGEERIRPDGLLHRDERVAPDRGDGDERQERGSRAPHRGTL